MCARPLQRYLSIPALCVRTLPALPVRPRRVRLPSVHP